MPDSTLTNSRIVAAYREKTPGSSRLADQAREIFPSGLTHDSRKLDPYGLYVDRAQGSRKWDVDGNEYVDYFGGHGALLLGHNHPEVVKATQEQLALGTHYGAGTELEVRWGDLVKKLIPCAEKVRFTSSGTEANLMAFRLARAFTGRNKIVRFLGHFHGWQDHVAFGVGDHLVEPAGRCQQADPARRQASGHERRPPDRPLHDRVGLAVIAELLERNRCPSAEHERCGPIVETVSVRRLLPQNDPAPCPG